MWTLHIPRQLPSGNDRACNGRDLVSRALYRKARHAWAVSMRLRAPRAAFVNADYQPKRRVTITRILGPRQREYDRDNLFSGSKIVLDAMKPARPAHQTTWKSGPRKGAIRLVAAVEGAGLIVDDSPQWLDLVMCQERGAEAGVLITIEDV